MEDIHDNDEVLTSDKDPKWVAGLRCHDDYHAKRLEKLMNTEGTERYEAAKMLLRDRDRKGTRLMQNLTKGEEFYKEYQKARNTKRITIDGSTKELAKEDETDQLLSRKELVAKAMGNISAPPTPTASRRPIDVGLRSRELWSPKSSNLYNMLCSLVDTGKSIDFNALNLLRAETFIGMPNTFRPITAGPDAGRMIRLFCVWSYFNKSFVVNKDVLMSVEFESQIIAPFIQSAEMVALTSNPGGQPGAKQSLKKQQKLYDKYLAAFRKNPVGPTGKAILGAHDPMIDGPINASEMAYNASSVPLRGVLKALSVNGDIHVRPLCTTGDLMLALYELVDDTIFEDGFIQLHDIPVFEKKGASFVPQKEAFASVSKNVPKLVYRLTHQAHRADTWKMARFVPSLLTKDLTDYVCPALCEKAFQFTDLSGDDVTPDMKRTSYVLQCALMGDTSAEKEESKSVLQSLTADFEVVFASNPNENCELLAMRNKLTSKERNESGVQQLPPQSNFQLRLIHVIEFKKAQRVKRNVAISSSVLGFAKNKFRKNMAKPVKKEDIIGTTAVNSLVSSTKIEPSEEEKKKESDVMVLLSRLSPEKMALIKPRRDSTNTDGVSPTPKALPPPKPYQRDDMRDDNGEKKLNPMDMTLEQRQEASRKQALILWQTAKEHVQETVKKVDVVSAFVSPLKKKRATMMAAAATAKNSQSPSKPIKPMTRKQSMLLLSGKISNLEQVYGSGSNTPSVGTPNRSGTNTPKAPTSKRNSWGEKEKKYDHDDLLERGKRQKSIGSESDSSSSSSSSESSTGDSSSDENNIATANKPDQKRTRRDRNKAAVKKEKNATPANKPFLSKFIGDVKNAIASKAMDVLDDFDDNISVESDEDEFDAQAAIERRRKRLVDAVVAREIAAIDPLNRLIEIIDKSVEEGIDPYLMRQKMYGDDKTTKQSRMLLDTQQAPDDVSTHNALKISLHRGSHLRYRVDGGFVGPLRDIYAYKEETKRDTEKDRVKNRRAVIKKRDQKKDTDSEDVDDEFSVHTEPSHLSVNSILRRHTHRQLVKTPKVSSPSKSSSPNRQRPQLDRRNSTLANMDNISPAPEPLNLDRKSSSLVASELGVGAMLASNERDGSAADPSGRLLKDEHTASQNTIRSKTTKNVPTQSVGENAKERNYSKAKHNPFDDEYMEELSESRSRIYYVKEVSQSKLSQKTDKKTTKQQDGNIEEVDEVAAKLAKMSREKHLKTKTGAKSHAQNAQNVPNLLPKPPPKKKVREAPKRKIVTKKRAKQKSDSMSQTPGNVSNDSSMHSQVEVDRSKRRLDDSDKSLGPSGRGVDLHVSIDSVNLGSGVSEIDASLQTIDNDERGEEIDEEPEGENYDDDGDNDDDNDEADEEIDEPELTEGCTECDRVGENLTHEESHYEAEVELDENEHGDDMFDEIEAHEQAANHDRLENSMYREVKRPGGNSDGSDLAQTSSITTPSGIFPTGSDHKSHLKFLFDIMDENKKPGETPEQAAARFRKQQRRWTAESEKILDNLVSNLEPMSLGKKSSSKGKEGDSDDLMLDSLADSLGIDASTLREELCKVNESELEKDDEVGQVAERDNGEPENPEVDSGSGDEELLQWQSSMLEQSIMDDSTTHYYHDDDEYDNMANYRKLAVERKVEKVIQLSRELVARREIERRRKEMVLDAKDAANRRIMEQREKIEREEKLAQARLLEQIYRRVRFLKTHVVDISDTAKLPFPSNEPDTRKKNWKKKKNRRRKKKRSQKKKPHMHTLHPLDEGEESEHMSNNDEDDERYEDRDNYSYPTALGGSEETFVRGALMSESVETSPLQLQRGGLLWGRTLSSSHVVYNSPRRLESSYNGPQQGEGMFDALVDDDERVHIDEEYVNSTLLAAQYGYLSSSAVDDVISLYNSDELMKLRSDILDHMSSLERHGMQFQDSSMTNTVIQMGNSRFKSNMTAVKQTASYFVHSLLSSAVVSLVTSQSYDENDSLSADEMISQQLSIMSKESKRGSDASFASKSSHSLRSYQFDFPTNMATVSHLSSYLTGGSSSKSTDRENSKNPLFRIDVQGDTYDIKESEIELHETGSGDITLLSSIHEPSPSAVNSQKIAYKAHGITVDSSTVRNSPMKNYGLPTREAKHVFIDPSTVKEAYQGGPGLRSRSNSPTRAKSPVVDPYLAEPMRVQTAPTATVHHHEVSFDALMQEASSSVVRVAGAGGPSLTDSSTEVPILRELPHRPVSQQASRYGGSARGRHRILTGYITPTNCKYGIGDGNGDFNGLAHLDGDSYVGPLEEQSIASDLLQSSYVDSIHQSSDIVVVKGNEKQRESRSKDPDLIVQGDVLGEERSSASSGKKQLTLQFPFVQSSSHSVGSYDQPLLEKILSAYPDDDAVDVERPNAQDREKNGNISLPPSSNCPNADVSPRMLSPSECVSLQPELYTLNIGDADTVKRGFTSGGTFGPGVGGIPLVPMAPTPIRPISSPVKGVSVSSNASVAPVTSLLDDRREFVNVAKHPKKNISSQASAALSKGMPQEAASHIPRTLDDILQASRHSHIKPSSASAMQSSAGPSSSSSYPQAPPVRSAPQGSHRGDGDRRLRGGGDHGIGVMENSVVSTGKNGTMSRSRRPSLGATEKMPPPQVELGYDSKQLGNPLGYVSGVKAATPRPPSQQRSQQRRGEGAAGVCGITNVRPSRTSSRARTVKRSDK